MSKRNKRTPSMAAARSSRAGARIGKSVPASKFRKASFMEGLRFFVRENVRMMLIFAGAATLLQAFIPWSNRIDPWPFILVGSFMLGLGVPKRFWK